MCSSVPAHTAMSRRAAAAAVLVASCAGGLLFVPSGVPQDHELEVTRHDPSQARPAEAGLLKVLSSDQSTFFNSARNLFFGLTLGLLVSLAGAAPAKAVNANQYSVPDRLPDSAWKKWPKDVPLVCNWPKDCTLLQAKAWGKAKSELWQLERLPGWDDKYSLSSTGVGTYRKYKMDLAWPARDSALGKTLIQDRADGLYDIPEIALNVDAKKDYPGNLPARQGDQAYDYRSDGFDDFGPYKSRNHLTLRPPVTAYNK